MAIEAGLMVRDRFPDRFPDVHLALFAARHDEGRDLRDEAVVRQVLKDGGWTTTRSSPPSAKDGPARHSARPTRRPYRPSGLRGAHLHRR